MNNPHLAVAALSHVCPLSLLVWLVQLLPELAGVQAAPPETTSAMAATVLYAKQSTAHTRATLTRPALNRAAHVCSRLLCIEHSATRHTHRRQTALPRPARAHNARTYRSRGRTTAQPHRFSNSAAFRPPSLPPPLPPPFPISPSPPSSRSSSPSPSLLSTPCCCLPTTSNLANSGT